MPHPRCRLAPAFALLMLAACTPTRPAAPPARPQVTPSQITGIVSCDRLLANYPLCYSRAGIYPANALAGRYQQMRDALTKAAADPAQRPWLNLRCQRLQQQLEQWSGQRCPD